MEAFLTTPNPTSLPPERFDANQAALAGQVTRIWARGGDVFARLEALEPAESPEQFPRITLRLPGGLVGGREVSLLKGDRLRLSGYLADLPQDEGLRDFLRRAERLDLLERHPELAGLDGRARRTLTCLVPESLEPLENLPPLNSVRLEGVVARAWEYDGQRFARLAVYDAHTAVTAAQPGKDGRPRRIPHYLSVLFPGGQVNGRPVSVRPKDRLRVSGCLVDRPYSEDLRSFLLDAHLADALASLPDSDLIADLRIRRSSACVVVQTLVQFTG